MRAPSVYFIHNIACKYIAKFPHGEHADIVVSQRKLVLGNIGFYLLCKKKKYRRYGLFKVS